MKQDSNKIVDLSIKERNVYSSNADLLNGILIGIALVMCVFTLIFHINLIISLIFIFVIFACMCVVSANDYVSMVEFETLHRTMLKEIYAEDLQ